MNDKKNKIPLSIKEIGLPKILLMVLAGILILICSIPDFSIFNNKTPEKSSKILEKSPVTIQKDNTQAYTENMERRLSLALKQIAGVGKANVMITLKSSKEQITLKDTNHTQNSSIETDSQGGSRNQTDISKDEETVMVQENSQGESHPYIVKEIEPDIEGVLVIAEGGDSATIINQINNIVQVLFNVPAHKIIVTKMI